MKEKAEAFGTGFCITLIAASLIWMSAVTFYRMENTVSQNRYDLLKFEKASSEKIKIVALNKEYFFDFADIASKIDKYSFYDFIIPSEIKAFSALVKQASDSAVSWLGSTF